MLDQHHHLPLPQWVPLVVVGHMRTTAKRSYGLVHFAMFGIDADREYCIDVVIQRFTIFSPADLNCPS